MLKKFATVVMLALAAAFVASCDRSSALIPHELDDRPPPPTPCGSSSLPFTSVYFDGRVYSYHMLMYVNEMPSALRDTHSFVGEISGYVSQIQDVTESLQANSARFVGLRAYHSGSSLMLHDGETYLFFRHISADVEN